MKDIILRELKKIEEQENVKIIMAIESGRRPEMLLNGSWMMCLISMDGILKRLCSCYIIRIQRFLNCNGITAIRVLTDTVGARILRCRVKEM